jgi:hypothetical protein
MDLKRSGPTSLPLAERKNVRKQTGKTADHNRHRGMTQTAKQKVRRHPFADRLTVSSRCNRREFRCRLVWADFELGSPDYQEKVLSKTFYIYVYPPHRSPPPSLGTGFPRLIREVVTALERKGSRGCSAGRRMWSCESCVPGMWQRVAQTCTGLSRYTYSQTKIKSQYSRIPGFQLRPYLQAFCWFQLIFFITW